MLQSWWDKVIDERLSGGGVEDEEEEEEELFLPCITEKEEGERGKPHKNNDSVGIVLGSEGSEGSEGTAQEGQEGQEGQERHDVVNGTAKEKETKKRTRTSGTTFGSISFIDRPVDDLIPLGAFCEMMISVEQAKDLHKKNNRRRYPVGVLYYANHGCCRTCKQWMEHYLWDWGVGGLVVVNTVIIIVEADIDANLTQGHVGHELDLCETLNLCFGVVYVIEMLSKIVVLGQQNYWLRLQHRFDAFTTSLVIVGQIIQAVMNAHEVPLSDVIQYILLLRLTRTLRLVVVVRRFNEIFNIFIALLPAFSTLFGMMWTVFSVYASVGMVLFGGKVTTNSTVLQNSTYGQSNYYSNNFNDFASSLVTLFELLVVNNWHVLMEGFVLVTTPYYRWYFISFWTIAVVVILNLVIAFVLEAFFNKDEQRRSSGRRKDGAGEMGERGGVEEGEKERGRRKRVRKKNRHQSVIHLHDGFM